jgi:phage gpG-like protein
MSSYVMINVFGDTQVEEELSRAMFTVEHMEAALNEVADDMMYVISRTFTSQGRRGGGSWQFITEDWAKVKEKKGWDPRILFAQDSLYNSFTRRGGQQILEIDDDTISLDSEVEYAHVHQEGGGPKNLPARPYIDFRSRDVEKWVGICEKHIYEAMGGLM